MKTVYIILVQVYSKNDNCWYDTYYDCRLDKNEAYRIALANSNGSNGETTKCVVEEVNFD
jgi:hypothetical protein